MIYKTKTLNLVFPKKCNCTYVLQRLTYWQKSINITGYNLSINSKKIGQHIEQNNKTFKWICPIQLYLSTNLTCVVHANVIYCHTSKYNTMPFFMINITFFNSIYLRCNNRRIWRYLIVRGVMFYVQVNVNLQSYN